MISISDRVIASILWNFRCQHSHTLNISLWKEYQIAGVETKYSTFIVLQMFGKPHLLFIPLVCSGIEISDKWQVLKSLKPSGNYMYHLFNNQ
jgi:hypothetical protein